MSQHGSVWLATSRSPDYPTLAGNDDVDVVVVGGGIAGATTAFLLQRAGMVVALVEADRIGSGTTGYTTGKVTSQHGLTYVDLIAKHGVDKARMYADANQKAVGLIGALSGAFARDTQFESASAYVYTQRVDNVAALEAELHAALKLGLPASLVTDVDLPVNIEAALRFDGQALFHPQEYLVGMVDALERGGARVYERSRVHDVTERDEHVTVRTADGEIRARHAILATLLPFVDRGGFFAKTRPSRSYGIAARIGGRAPKGMYISAEMPTRSVRPWHHEGLEGIVVVGEDHPTGTGDASPARWGALERWARDHFDVSSFDYRWSAQDYETVDGIPYVGRSPRMTRTYVATGFRKWGLTGGTAAAVMLSDAVRGRENPWFPAFDSTRIGNVDTVKKLVAQNLHVGKEYVQARIERIRAPAVEHLERGEGGIVHDNGSSIGAYRAPDGTISAVTLACTHLGCTVRWNPAERSWDCPCHGSRFATDGSVLNGPAVEPLDSIPVEDLEHESSRRG